MNETLKPTPASAQALQLPELLEQILYDCLSLDTEKPLQRLYTLRRVCRLWSEVTKSSRFANFGFLNPRIRESGEEFRMNTEFQIWLFDQLNIPAFARNSDGRTSGFVGFDQFAKMILGGPGGGRFPDVFLTQPAWTKISLLFSYYGESEWSRIFDTYRKKDRARIWIGDSLDQSRQYWVGHQHIIIKPEGIRTTDILEKIISTLQKMRSIDGAFKVFEIVLRFGILEDAFEGDPDDDRSDGSLDDCEREYILWSQNFSKLEQEFDPE